MARTFFRAEKAICRLFEFGCDKCGYQADDSGGEDAGWLVVIRTMTSLICKRVVDVVVGESHPGSLGSDISILGRCPRCRSRQVVPWGKSRPCPKCGGAMKKTGHRPGVLLGLIK